jgi:transposase InsO family protein
MEECELPSIPVLPREGPLLRVPQPFEAISNDELFREQRSDPWCGDLLDQISLKRPDTRPAGLFVDDDGLICCRSQSGLDFPPRWIAPASLRERICTLAHFARATGHPGATRMSQTLGRAWYWPNLAKDCAATVRRCHGCSAKRLKRGPKRSVPLTIFAPEQPLEFIAMDVLGPLPATVRGNRFVLCITDRFSKMSVAVAIPDQTASTVAQALVDRWVYVFVIPITILSDNGSAFADERTRRKTRIHQRVSTVHQRSSRTIQRNPCRLHRPPDCRERMGHEFGSGLPCLQFFCPLYDGVCPHGVSVYSRALPRNMVPTAKFDPSRSGCQVPFPSSTTCPGSKAVQRGP